MVFGCIQLQGYVVVMVEWGVKMLDWIKKREGYGKEEKEKGKEKGREERKKKVSKKVRKWNKVKTTGPGIPDMFEQAQRLIE